MTLKPQQLHTSTKRLSSGRKAVTIGVATLCDDRKAIVLVADKMIGVGFIEGEPDIKKIFRIHPDWWLLIAGDDITHCFEVIDSIARDLPQAKPLSVQEVMNTVAESYEQKRLENAERLHLRSIGWTLTHFNQEGFKILPKAEQIQDQIRSYSLNAEFLVAGFGPDGIGHVFSMAGFGEYRGIARRHDIPGFEAIGAGATAADYMMFYRTCSPSMKIREALYFSIEAKFFGEFASGVGLRTDVYILRHNQTPIEINDRKTVEAKIMKMCDRLSPQDFTRKDVEELNNIPELSGIEQLKKPRKKRKIKIDV